MLVESQKKLEGNARFEGFTIDLADELSKFLQFNYTIKLVDDGAYGSETSPGRAVSQIVQHFHKIRRRPLFLMLSHSQISKGLTVFKCLFSIVLLMRL